MTSVAGPSGVRIPRQTRPRSSMRNVGSPPPWRCWWRVLTTAQGQSGRHTRTCPPATRSTLRRGADRTTAPRHDAAGRRPARVRTLTLDRPEALNACCPQALVRRHWPQAGRAFRFDDPDGRGRAAKASCSGPALPTPVLPLTYRGAELDGAEEHLVGTTEHSELGPRWVYDGCADPVFVGELVRAVLTGGTGVDHEYDIGNGRGVAPTKPRCRAAAVRPMYPSSRSVGCHDEGPLTIVNAGPLELAVARIVGTYVDAAETLAVTWKGGNDIVIAGVGPG